MTRLTFGTTAVSTPTSGKGLVLAAGRPKEIVAFDEEVVGFFVDAATILGVPKSVAAIYGVVFASPLPLSFADIEERLDVSKGSISQGLRVLREVGALKEVSAAADRAELFTPDLQMRKLIGRFLEVRVQKQLEAGNSRLSALKKAASARRNDEAEILQQRLKSLSDWHSKARGLMPIANAFLKLGS